MAISFGVYAQKNAQDWVVIEDNSEFTVEKSSIICKSSQGWDYEYVVTKFTNHTNEDITISFVFEKWYGDFCSGCSEDSDLGTTRTVTIPANSVIQGDCDSPHNYLKTFHHSVTVNDKTPQGKLTKIVINKIVKL